MEDSYIIPMPPMSGIAPDLKTGTHAGFLYGKGKTPHHWM
jgi:hypothetical protein